MRIETVRAKNYRSLEDFEIKLDSNYNVIAGRNNSGKTCIFRIIRILLGSTNRVPFMMPRIEVEWSEDVTQWKKADKPDIFISTELLISKEDDPGMIEYITRMKKDDRPEIINKIEISKKTNSDNIDIDEIKIDGVSISDDYAKNEILRWIRESEFVIHHDSTNYTAIQGALAG